MKRYILPLFLLLSVMCNAQEFSRAIGFRTGFNSGVTYKYFLNENDAYELILGLNNGIIITALKENHRFLLNDFSDRVFYFYGFGAHMGFQNFYENSDNTNYTINFRNIVTKPVLGLDAIIGAEYRFKAFPVSIGLELKPFFNLFGKGYFNFYYSNLSLSVKYMIQ